MSVLVVRGLVAALGQAGVDASGVLRAARFDVASLSAPATRVTLDQVCQLIEVALDHSTDEALGLHWSDRLDAGTFAPVSHLISSSRDLRQALHTLQQYYRLISDGDDYRFTEEESQVTLRMTTRFHSVRVQRFAAEMLIASFFRLVQRFNVVSAPHWVGFEHPAPAYHAEYTRVFGAVVHFDQPFSGLRFDRSLLDAASPRRDNDANAALRSLAEQRLAQLPAGAKYAARVRDILIRELGPNRVDMSAVARTLGLTERSLRRHLTAEGRPYHELARDAAVHTAKRLLQDQRMTIQETAHEMGFSDIGSFYRAFKRWTGTTPRKFRES